MFDWRHALFSMRDDNSVLTNRSYRTPSSVAILAMKDKTGRVSGWHIPGISCLASIVSSLRDIAKLIHQNAHVF